MQVVQSYTIIVSKHVTVVTDINFHIFVLNKANVLNDYAYISQNMKSMLNNYFKNGIKQILL